MELQESTLSLNKKQSKEFIIKSWMIHDGAWFNYCLQEVGIEKTNKINKAASKSLGMIEIKRFMKNFGIESVNSFNDLKILIISLLKVVKADFMKISHDFSIFNELNCEMPECFAYNGIKRIGAIEIYECGIFDRIEGWFQSLGIGYDVEPKIEGCMMHEQGKCYRKFKFNFSE
jgi:hypothetical protein